MNIMADKITISKKKYESMKKEIETLRNTKLYKRILEFEKNIAVKKYTREDLGF